MTLLSRHLSTMLSQVPDFSKLQRRGKSGRLEGQEGWKGECHFRRFSNVFCNLPVSTSHT